MERGRCRCPVALTATETVSAFRHWSDRRGFTIVTVAGGRLTVECRVERLAGAGTNTLGSRDRDRVRACPNARAACREC